MLCACERRPPPYLPTARGDALRSHRLITGTDAAAPARQPERRSGVAPPCPCLGMRLFRPRPVFLSGCSGRSGTSLPSKP